MSTFDEKARRATYESGWVVVRLEDGLEIRFPVAKNPRLSAGTEKELKNITVSPMGLHWPDLDEDLSFQGLAAGNFGQKCRTK